MATQSIRTGRRLLTGLLALQLTALAASADDALSQWPQWRGPLGNGTAPRANPPLRWSETNNVRWKTRLPGAGTATPIVWKNRIFILAAVPTGRKLDPAEAQQRRADLATLPDGGNREVSENVTPPDEYYQITVLCLDRSDGRILWEHVAREEAPHDGHHRDHGYASASPVTDGTHLIVSFGSQGLHGYTLAGERVWQQDPGKLFTRKSFGEGSSPALHGNTVVLARDHELDDVVLAFDKSTGQELWRTRRDEPTSWSTPIIVEHGGVPQVIVASTGGLRGYDLRNGRELWSGPPLTDSVIPTPAYADGVVIAVSDYRKRVAYALRLGGDGDPTVAWSYSGSAPYVSSPLRVGDLVYFGSKTSGRLTCLDAASGRSRFESEDLEGVRNLYASPLAASGRVYVLGREGTCVVLKQGPDLEILATNILDEPTDASMALVDNEIFIRSHQSLYCIAGN